MATASFAVQGRVFKQTYVVRLILGLFILGLAAVIGIMAFDNQPADKPALYVAGILVAAYAVIWILIGRTVLTISDMGLKYESVFGTKEILWGQINETRYMVTPINVAAHFGLVGLLISAFSSQKKAANLTFRVISSAGQEIKITSNFRDDREAISMVLSRILPGMVSDAKTRIDRGETVQFGPVGLAKAGVTWKSKAPIPLTDIKSAELGGNKLRVKCTGKWLDAIAVRSDKVPNVLVFLEVLEALAPQLKMNSIDPLARVRM